MEMTNQRWAYTNDYLHEVFGGQDDHLAGLMSEAVDAGLPEISINAVTGRLLMMLARTTPGRLAIEVGTLAGYSGIWITRGLSPGGRLITIDINPKHADFAARQFEIAGVAERIEQRRGAGLDVLKQLAGELEPGSVDLVFLDAVKTEYPAYWELARPLLAVGGLILADNALAGGSWFIDDEADDNRNAADRLNRMVASDPDLEAVALPLRQGVLMGRRMK